QLHENILSESDIDFWNENGYIVIKDAITQAQCSAARKAIWDLLEAYPHEPESWYKEHPAKNGLMLNFFDHPALDANRRSAKIHKAYSQLYGETEIYLLVDKVSFNPPEANGY